jgi:hypothetical protein
MRRLVYVAVLALGLAACGGSGASKGTLEITFGLSGGTMRNYSVTIGPGGAVSGLSGPAASSIPSAQHSELSSRVRSAFATLKSEQCPGTFPDESARFITALGKTVTVRGACEPGFTKLWNELDKAVA